VFVLIVFWLEKCFLLDFRGIFFGFEKVSEIKCVEVGIFGGEFDGFFEGFIHFDGRNCRIFGVL
jgi:hypothetical protein